MRYLLYTSFLFVVQLTKYLTLTGIFMYSNFSNLYVVTCFFSRRSVKRLVTYSSVNNWRTQIIHVARIKFKEILFKFCLIIFSYISELTIIHGSEISIFENSGRKHFTMKKIQSDWVRCRINVNSS